MRAVEQPQLGLLPRRDVPRECHARRSEVGPFPGETVLEHPLEVALGLDERLVAVAVLRGVALDRLGSRRRHDAVDHRAGEGAVLRDPCGETAVARARQFQHGLAQHDPVARQVVAAYRGERRQAGFAARIEGGDQESHRRARPAEICQVGRDCGISEIEPPAIAREAVALFGHRQRDDPDGRLRHRRDHRGGGFGCDQHPLERPHDPRAFSPCVALDQRVEPILRRERVARGGRAQRYPDHAPAPVAARGDLVEARGLVRPVERAEPEMDHAFGQVLARVSRPLDRSAELGQQHGGEPFDHSL